MERGVREVSSNLTTAGWDGSRGRSRLVHLTMAFFFSLISTFTESISTRVSSGTIVSQSSRSSVHVSVSDSCSLTLQDR